MSDKPPREKGGRSARNGFIYQDHVGASILLDVLDGGAIAEVYFEARDDICVVSNDESVLMVQVKHNEEKGSRWSIPDLTRRKSGKKGTSIIEKSIEECRVSEQATAKFITSYGVIQELRCLKDAQRNQKAEDAIISDIQTRLSDCNANELEWWVRTMRWVQMKQDIPSQSEANSTRLERILEGKGIFAPLDQRAGLYDKILKMVRDASSISAPKVVAAKFINWFDQQVKFFSMDRATSGELKRKLESVGKGSEFLSANEQRLRYLEAKYSDDYIGEDDLKVMEDEMLDRLAKLRASLHDGTTAESNFHSACVKEACCNNEFQGLFIPSAYLTGYMYEVTDRCLHHFGGEI